MPSQFEAVAGSALGYSDDDTGSVTQATNKGTGVTLNKPSGVITMNDAALGAATLFASPHPEAPEIAANQPPRVKIGGRGSDGKKVSGP